MTSFGDAFPPLITCNAYNLEHITTTFSLVLLIIVRGRMNQNPIQTLEKAVLRQKDMYRLNPLVVLQPDTYSVLCFSIE